MKLSIIDGPPGSRKSITMLTEILTAPGRKLVASPRVDLLREQIAFLETKADELRISLPSIRAAYGGNPCHRGNVERQITDYSAELADADHAILFVTHEGLKLANLDPFSGWHACIDEIPDSTASGTFSASAAYRQFKDAYDLDPVGDGHWWHVVPRCNAPSMKEVMKDDVVQSLRPFFKQVHGRQHVFVNVGNWDDAKDGRPIRWWSIWTPLVLKKCASVTIAAANFDSSLCRTVLNAWFADEVTVETKLVSAVSKRACPKVRIHYFTQSHTGSTAFWSTSQGRWCLVQVREYLKSIGGVGFWSGNEVTRNFMEHSFPGQMVLPKLAGTNSLIEHTSCLLIYSNKASEQDDPILDVFDLNREEVKRARETEDLIQFVMRGALRRPEFDQTFCAFLYDRTQAEALEVYLRNAGVADDVTLVPVSDAGILDVEVERPPSKAHVEVSNFVTAVDQEADRKANVNARQAKSRETKKMAKIAAGMYRGPGRPTKVK